MLITKKRHNERIAKLSEMATAVDIRRNEELHAQAKIIEDYEKRWKSPDGKRVLNDLQTALNLIRGYQKSLQTLGAVDPHIGSANKLLITWGMQPISEIEFGAKTSKWDREMEKYGEESFKKDRVRIVAERNEDSDRIRVENIDDDPKYAALTLEELESDC